MFAKNFVKLPEMKGQYFITSIQEKLDKHGLCDLPSLSLIND